MDYKGLLRRPGKIPQPAENLLLIGMGRKAVDRFDFRANGDHLPEHLDLLFPVLKRSAACPFSLKSNEKNRCPWTRAPKREMVQDPPAGRHAARRDDDQRTRQVIDGPRLFRRARSEERRVGKEWRSRWSPDH